MARRSSTSTSASPEQLRAERFLRTGTPVPVIYWGVPAHFERAVREARQASMFVPGEHFIEAVRRNGREVLQVWQDGVCCWNRETDALTIT